MTNLKSSEQTPALQPPGAGLPWVERMIARHWIFPRFCGKQDWQSAAKLFQDEGRKVLAVWDLIPAERLTERVLVRRAAGMEDSSRFWSAAMTVEHLNIVGQGIRRTIQALRRGVVPDRVARTQDVKPTGEWAVDAVHASFLQLLEEAAVSESPVPPGQGPVFAHPWFGPLDAFQWHCVLGMHQGIHRKQIEAIREGLKQKQARS